MTSYPCKIMSWLDGDTCLVSVDLINTDLGFHVTLFRTIRVFGMNAPEVHSKSADEKARGLAAKEYAELRAPVGSDVTVHSAKEHGTEKFGRWLASVTLANGQDYATTMISAGHALPWDGKGEKPI